MDKSRRELLRRSAIVGAGLGTISVLTACNSTGSTPFVNNPNNPGGSGTGTGGGTGGGTSTGGTGTPAPTPPTTPFKHSVASGDPLHDRVMLWTRITIDGQTAPVATQWEMATSQANLETGSLIASGTEDATSDHDFCVKVDVTSLSPNTTYYYRFKASVEGTEFTSFAGRTKTLPLPTSQPTQFRVAVASCSSFAHGFFNAYRAISKRQDLDLILHLGDYIYEYGDGEYGSNRGYDPAHEMFELDHYRRRHKHYKADVDLQAAHQQYAFINIWDDHESTNDSYKDGAENHTPGAEGEWQQRKAWSIQAYFEWLPIRPIDNNGNFPNDPYRSAGGGRTWRKFPVGQLADLIMFDTRLYDREVVGSENPGFTDAQVRNDDSGFRDLLGNQQETWIHNQIKDSTAQWKLLGQQIMVGQFRVFSPSFSAGPAEVNTILGATGGTSLPAERLYFNPDQWDGYPESRDRLFNVLYNNDVNDDADPTDVAHDNVVVLTGDIHTSWAIEINKDPDAKFNAIEAPDPNQAGTKKFPNVAVEFVTQSVTSPGLPLPEGFDEAFVGSVNDHMKYINLSKHGYTILDVTPERCQSDWYDVGDDASLTARNGGAEALLKTARVNAATASTDPYDKNILVLDEPATPARTNPPAFAMPVIDSAATDSSAAPTAEELNS